MNCFHSNIKQKEKSTNRESKTTNDEQSSKNNEHKQEQDHTKDKNRPSIAFLWLLAHSYYGKLVN